MTSPAQRRPGRSPWKSGEGRLDLAGWRARSTKAGALAPEIRGEHEEFRRDQNAQRRPGRSPRKSLSHLFGLPVANPRSTKAGALAPEIHRPGSRWYGNIY